MRHIETPARTVNTIRFSPDGRRLHLLSHDTTRRFGRFHSACSIDIRYGSLIAEVMLDPSGDYPSNAAIFSPDLRSAYRDCGGDYYTDIRKVELATGRERVLLQADFMHVWCLTITPNEHILALGGVETGDDGGWGIRRVDVIHGTVLDLIRAVATCIAYSPDGRLLAEGGQLREGGPSSGIRIWSGKQLVEEFAEPARHLAWSPDERLAWGMGQQLNLARPGTKEPVRTWTGSPGELSSLGFSPDGRLLLTGTDRGVCALHDTTADQVRATFDWGIGPIHSVTFSPDGLTCAAGGEGGQVVVWDVDA